MRAFLATAIITFCAAGLLQAVAANTSPVAIKLRSGQFVFDPPIIEINKGDSITWTPTAGNHILAPKSGNAFTQTVEFNKDSPVDARTITFPDVGDIEYLCLKHPVSMQGTIKVR